MTGSSGPSLAEVRAKGQPPEVLARLNDEHWFGRLYMRRLSPYATVLFARLGWSPNAVTVCFMISGAAAGVLAAVPGLPAAVAVAVLIQLYLLFDCSDGELARYTGRFSAAGVYLDRMGHYIAEALLLAGLGVRAQGHFSLTGSYVSAGLAAAICATLIKAETDGVVVARASSGLGGTHDDQALTPRSQGLALARRLASALRVHRIIQAVELSVLILAAAIADAAAGDLTATRVLTVAALVVGVLMTVAHLVAVVASRRLRLETSGEKRGDEGDRREHGRPGQPDRGGGADAVLRHPHDGKPPGRCDPGHRQRAGPARRPGGAGRGG